MHQSTMAPDIRGSLINTIWSVSVWSIWNTDYSICTKTLYCFFFLIFILFHFYLRVSAKQSTLLVEESCWVYVFVWFRVLPSFFNHFNWIHINLEIKINACLLLSFFVDRLNLKDFFPALETDHLGGDWGSNGAPESRFENRNLNLMCNSPLTDSELSPGTWIPWSLFFFLGKNVWCLVHKARYH